MGRPRKNKENEVIEVVSVETDKIDLFKIPAKPFKRNEHGLYDHINYKFKSSGFIDWRAMVSSEHIVLNKENFLKKENPIDVDQLSEEELESLKFKALERDILIKLSGYKELAQLRGYSGIYTDVKYFEESNFAQANCTINWIPNYETEIEVTSNGNADACPENTSGFAGKFLIAIAENRAFIRAVRNFLQINIVGQDELKSETPEDFREGGPTLLLSGPQGAIAKKLKDNKRNLSELAQFAISKYEYSLSHPENWNRVQDIPSADAAFLLDKFEEFLKRE